MTSQVYQATWYSTTTNFTYITKLDQAGSMVIYEIYDASKNLSNQKIVTSVTMTANTARYGFIFNNGGTTTLSSLQVYNGLKTISEV